MRNDISPGQKIAQAIHATGESVTGKVPKNTVAVALVARDQQHLLELADKLTVAGIDLSQVSGSLISRLGALSVDRRSLNAA